MTTLPLSYHQSLSAFWTADASAIGTGLGGIGFIDFQIRRPVRNRFVAEHVSESRPARVIHGLGHLGFREAGRVNVPYRDEIEVADQPRTELVQEISAPVRDLRMDAPRRLRFASLLGRRQPRFVRAVVLGGLYFLARAERRQRLQAKVKADAAIRFASSDRNGQDDVYIPVAKRVPREGPAVQYAGRVWNWPRQPEAYLSGRKENFAVTPNYIFSAKRHPSEILSPAITQLLFFMLAQRSNVAGAYCVDRGGRNSKLFGGSGCNFMQIVAGRPCPTPFHRVPLHIVAVVPDEIHRPRHAVEHGCVLVLHAVAVGEDSRGAVVFHHRQTYTKSDEVATND